MLFSLLELFAFSPEVANWISYPLPVISLVALTAALYETFTGYKVTDAEELQSDNE